MMRIGQITSWICNYGTILQCYATQLLFGNKQVEIVLLIRKESKIASLLLKTKKAFQLFILSLFHPTFIRHYYNYLQKSRKKYSGKISEQQQAMDLFRKKEIKHEYIRYTNLKRVAKTNKYSFFICGSDQIWNPYNVFLDDMFFLRFSPNNKKVAFSPSFGCTELPVFNKRTMKKYLKGFRFLSSREESGKIIIKNLLNKDATILNDPVLMISKENWLEMVKQSSFINPYPNNVVLYFLDEPKIDAVRNIFDIAKNNGLKILILGTDYPVFSLFDDRNVLMNLDPLQFVGYINSATFVFTDSFHGTAMSLILNKDFFCFKRNYGHSNDQSTRILSLLSQLDIANRFGETITQEFKPIDYLCVNERLLEIREKANGWVNEVIRYYERDDTLG